MSPEQSISHYGLWWRCRRWGWSWAPAPPGSVVPVLLARASGQNRNGGPNHVIHNVEAVGRLLTERLPGTVEQLVKTAAPEVVVTVVGVELEVLEEEGSRS